MKIIRAGHFLLLYLFFSCFFFNRFHIGSASVKAGNDPVFSLGLRDAALNSCLERISILSEYKIFVTGQDRDYRISIDLKNVTIEKALPRILKGINHTMEWDTQHRKVTLSLYGRQKINYKTKKKSGVSPLLHLKTRIKEAGPNPNLSGSSGAGIKRRDYSRKSNVNLNVSGVNTTFVQGTPTGHLGP